MQAPAPGQRPGMPPAGAPAPGGVPGMPMPVSPVIQAMQPRPYPNPVQMANPVGIAGVMRQQMMMQEPTAPPTKGKGKSAQTADKKESPSG